jgi:hypothetical protein
LTQDRYLRPDDVEQLEDNSEHSIEVAGRERPSSTDPRAPASTVTCRPGG